MAKRNRDDFVDLVHAARHRRDPLGGQHVEREIGSPLPQAREQRLRHQRVADPVRRHREDPRH